MLKCGQRELDMVKRYATHDYDSVLGQYYAKARFYDAGSRRFTAMDPIKGFVAEPASITQYLYVKNGPLVYIDENGEIFTLVTGAIGAVVGGVVGGVTAAVKSYKETGKVDVSSTLKSAAVGAAVGGVIGLTAGAAATVVAGAAATTTIATGSALSTAAVVAGSKTAAAFAVGATVVASASAGKDVGTTGKVDVPKTVAKAVVGGTSAVAMVAAAPLVTSLTGAGSIGAAAKAVVTEIAVNPIGVQNTVLTGAAETISLISANMAIDRGDYLSAAMHIAFAGAYMKPFAGCAASTAQSLSNTISAQNQTHVVAALPGSQNNPTLEELPQSVQDSYKKYDSTGWKGNVSGQTPGTHAGSVWRNNNGQLPAQDINGKSIVYREFDVNNYIGPTRDTERFIVGSDGSVWYTDSHYGQSTSINGINDFVRIK